MKKRFIALKKQHPDAQIIISSRPLLYRQHDIAYPYEAGATFRYLTRLNIHPCTVVLSADNQLHVFLPCHDPDAWLWHGPQTDTEHPGCIEADHIHPLTELGRWIKKHATKRGRWLTDPISQALLRTEMQGIHPRSTVEDITAAVAQLRSIKDAYAVAAIQEAVDVSIASHSAVMHHASTDTTECALEGLFLSTGYARGYRDLAYPPIVATGAHATILHYSRNNAKAQACDWLLLDAGWQAQGYASDITRTYPLHKNATGIRRAVYNAVLDVQRRTMADIAPGIHWHTLEQRARQLLQENLQSLGLLQQPCNANMLRTYFPHRLGHWLGLAVHDECPYTDAHHQPIAFAEGMVLTIEPGVYFPLQDPAIPDALRGFGVRIEDTVLVSATGYSNLSAALPVALDDIAHV